MLFLWQDEKYLVYATKEQELKFCIIQVLTNCSPEYEVKTKVESGFKGKSATITCQIY